MIFHIAMSLEYCFHGNKSNNALYMYLQNCQYINICEPNYWNIHFWACWYSTAIEKLSNKPMSISYKFLLAIIKEWLWHTDHRELTYAIRIQKIEKNNHKFGYITKRTKHNTKRINKYFHIIKTQSSEYLYPLKQHLLQYVDNFLTNLQIESKALSSIHSYFEKILKTQQPNWELLNNVEFIQELINKGQQINALNSSTAQVINSLYQFTISDIIQLWHNDIYELNYKYEPLSQIFHNQKIWTLQPTDDLNGEYRKVITIAIRQRLEIQMKNYSWLSAILQQNHLVPLFNHAYINIDLEEIPTNWPKQPLDLDLYYTHLETNLIKLRKIAIPLLIEHMPITCLELFNHKKNAQFTAEYFKQLVLYYYWLE